MGEYLQKTTEMLKGLLEGCVLQIIGRGETYGYEITRHLRKLGFRDVAEGTVYTILVRLEKTDMVSTKKKPSTLGPPRKFYTLTKAGHAELGRFWDRWELLSSRIDKLKNV